MSGKWGGLSRFFQKSTHPNPAIVGNSQFPMYSSRKRTFDAANLNSFPNSRVPVNPRVSVIQETGQISSVPPAATVTSKSEKIQAFRDHWNKVKGNIFKDISQSDPVSDSPPIQNLGSEFSQELPVEFWSQATEILDRITASGSISVTKVSTGSQIEKSSSQSPVLAEAPEKVTSPLKTTFVHAEPPVSKGPTSTETSKSAPSELSQGEGEGWQQILDRYKDMLNLD